MCPKPFSWAKNKIKLFSDGKSRGPLLARAALKTSACFRMDQHGRVKNLQRLEVECLKQI